jgi:PAS domain-containing serine/threonine kinase
LIFILPYMLRPTPTALQVKLIDFGSAAVVDTSEPRPYYGDFYGTVEYAAPEILAHQDYQAAPAEIWTLGVLLSYLLTGTSPFLTTEDARKGRIVVANVRGAMPSRAAVHLMSRCLDPNVLARATISEVKAHRWLTQKCT